MHRRRMRGEITEAEFNKICEKLFAVSLEPKLTPMEQFKEDIVFAFYANAKVLN